MGDLTKNFSSDEMKCKCGCNICNIDDVFMNKLQCVRDLVFMPLTITSGCRCPAYNKTCGGKPTSDHITTGFLKCEGVDIKCSVSGLRFKIIKAALKVGINRIGIARSFIHLGTARGNPQDVIWVY